MEFYKLTQLINLYTYWAWIKTIENQAPRASVVL